MWVMDTNLDTSPSCLVESYGDIISSVSDPMTGEVYASLCGTVQIGCVVKWGFVDHEKSGESPLSETGNMSPIFARVLCRADMKRVLEIKSRLPESSHLPLLSAPWYRVLYD
jgi:hypothetical protein